MVTSPASILRLHRCCYAEASGSFRTLGSEDVCEEWEKNTRGTKPSDGPAGESQTVRIICGRHVKNMNLKQKVGTKNHETPGTGPRSAPWLTAHTNQQVIRSTSTNSSCSWMFLNVTASRTKSCSAFKTFDFSQVCRNKRFKYSFKISV